MNYKMVCCVLAICFCFCATSCVRDSGENSETISSSTSLSDSKELGEKKIHEDITFELSQIENAGRAHGSSYSVEKTDFVWTQVKDILLEDKEIETEQELSEGYTCATSDSDLLTVTGGGNIFFATDRYLNKISPTVTVQENAPGYNGDHFDAQKDLPFMTQDQAIKKALSLLDNLKITNMAVQKTYVLEHSQLQKEQDALAEAGEAWTFDKEKNERIPVAVQYTEEDDFYYFTLWETLDGIHITPYPHGSPDDDSYVTGARAEMILSSRGIEYLSVESHYMVMNKEEEEALIRPEQAIQALENKYDQIILSNPVTVENMSLLYVPEIVNKNENKFELTPVWAFFTTEEITALGAKDNKAIKETMVYFNAVNGKESV